MAIDFDGAASKLESTGATTPFTAQMTILAWLLADGQGEGSFGRIVQAPEDATAGITTVGFFYSHFNAANTLEFAIVGDSGAQGAWTFPATDGAWHAVGLSFDRTDTANVPAVRVDFASVTATAIGAAWDTSFTVPTGYCVGNRTDSTRTWDGAMQYLSIHQVILTAGEMDMGLRRPGSVRRGMTAGPMLLMRTATDIINYAGTGSNPTGTSLTTRGTAPPVLPMWAPTNGYVPATRPVVTPTPPVVVGGAGWGPLLSGKRNRHLVS